MRKKLDILFLVVFLAIAAFSGWKLFGITRAYRTEADVYHAIEQQYVTPVAAAPSETGRPESPTGETAPDASSERLSIEQPPIRVDFEALRQENPDTVGWIYCEDTPINYPVVQCGDNTTYLSRNFRRDDTGGGAIFLDCVNSSLFTDENSILYGHHMKDGSMFGSLQKFRDRDYMDAHSTLWLLTPEGDFRVQVFAAQTVDAAGWAYDTVFLSREARQAFLDTAMRSAAALGESLPTADDRILTLSTCAYDYETARFVLMGYLERCE